MILKKKKIVHELCSCVIMTINRRCSYILNNLKLLREEKGISQNVLIEELEKAPYNLKISRRTLQYWESSQRDIKTDKAEKLAKYFSVTVPYLLGYENSGFGRRLKELREVNYLTIERVSRDLDIPTELWEDFETRDNFVPGEKLASQIARYFGVDKDFLLGKSTIINKRDFQSLKTDSYIPIPSDEASEKQLKDLEEEQRNKKEFEEEQRKINSNLFITDFSKLIDFKHDEDSLNEIKLSTLEYYNKLDSEYKKMLFINAIDLIDESKEKDLFKISNNIYSMQEYEKFDRKMWLEEMEYRHKNNLPLPGFDQK